MVVGFKSPTWSVLHIESGMRLTLALRSRKAQLMATSPMAQGMEKLIGSLILGGCLFWRMALHSSANKTMQSLEASSYWKVFLLETFHRKASPK